jgi:hypothetical protein
MTFAICHLGPLLKLFDQISTSIEWFIEDHPGFLAVTLCPKTSERNFNLGVLNLYEIHFLTLLSVKYLYPISNVILHRI